MHVAAREAAAVVRLGICWSHSDDGVCRRPPEVAIRDTGPRQVGLAVVRNCSSWRAAVGSARASEHRGLDALFGTAPSMTTGLPRRVLAWSLQPHARMQLEPHDPARRIAPNIPSHLPYRPHRRMTVRISRKKNGPRARMATCHRKYSPSPLTLNRHWPASFSVNVSFIFQGGSRLEPPTTIRSFLRTN